MLLYKKDTCENTYAEVGFLSVYLKGLKLKLKPTKNQFNCGEVVRIGN